MSVQRRRFLLQVIVARRKMLQEAGGIEKLMEKKQAGGTHTRLAFLDLMLGMVEKGELDLEGLEEETNTFTFEVTLLGYRASRRLLQ